MRLFFLSGAVILASSCGRGQPTAQTHILAETRPATVAHLAYGDAATKTPIRHPWPVDLLSIGHTMASYQNYGGSPYFHHGIDIRAEAGSDVIAAAGGEVVNIENYFPGNDAYWEIAILDDEGFLWQYHHVERNSIPSGIWDAYRRGGSVASGTKIGEVYYWYTQAFGERFHHIHLNVLDGNGHYQNPFAFLEPLADEAPPQIVDLGLLKNGRRYNGSVISGSYRAFATVHDLILHDRFVVPAYEVKMQIDGGDETVVWRFDDLPGGSSNSRFVRDYFVDSMTCGDYDCRELTVDLGFGLSGAQNFTGEAGAHTLRITATDFAGNVSEQTLDWTVD